MLLAVDIGNTNTSLGVFDGENLTAHWRIVSQPKRTTDEIGILICQLFQFAEINRREISAVVISSVVPELNSVFQISFQKYFALDAIVLDSTFDFGLKIKYNPPTNVGIDRLVAASAAIFKYGKPCIVCDFGTATTIDAVNSNGEYLGGIIAPGMRVLADALFEKTAKLPKVEVKKPENIVGNSTVNSIQSGIYFGYIGLVDGIVRRMLAELGEKSQIIATGGLADLIAESSETIELVNENLMLEGLRFAYEKIEKPNTGDAAMAD